MRENQVKKSANLQKALAEERMRIGEELHSRAAQSLSHALFLLNLHEKHHKTEDLDGARQAIKLAINEIRHTIGKLRDEEPWPLVPSLRDCVNAFKERWRIPVSLSVEGFHLNISPDARHFLLTLVEEGLTNVSKHAQATRCEVFLKINPQSMKVLVKDNGVGYKPKPEGRPHFGLKFMRERARQIGGKLSIRSANGKGTILEAVIPSGNSI